MRKSRLTLAFLVSTLAISPGVANYNEDMYLGGVKIPRKRYCKCGNILNLSTSDICKDCFMKLRSK